MKKVFFSLFLFAFMIIVPFVSVGCTQTGDVEARITDEYVQWKGDDGKWKNLISVDKMKEMLGDANLGLGESAYEIYCRVYGYNKTEQEWLDDLKNGTLLTEPAVAGDLNSNGKIDLSDVINLRSLISNKTPLTPREKFIADVNQDGFVTDADSGLLRSYLANYDYDTETSGLTLPITVKYGDIDLDGDVDNDDLTLLKSGTSLSNQAKYNADVNSDGTNNALDIDIFEYYLASFNAGLNRYIVSLPFLGYVVDFVNDETVEETFSTRIFVEKGNYLKAANLPILTSTEGKTFLGWYTTTSGAITINDVQVTKYFEPKENLVLKAKWSDTNSL